jgi:hypothetical protein
VLTAIVAPAPRVNRATALVFSASDKLGSVMICRTCSASGAPSVVVAATSPPAAIAATRRVGVAWATRPSTAFVTPAPARNPTMLAASLVIDSARSAFVRRIPLAL